MGVNNGMAHIYSPTLPCNARIDKRKRQEAYICKTLATREPVSHAFPLLWAQLNNNIVGSGQALRNAESEQ